MKINSELPFDMLMKFNLELNEYDFVLFHLYESDPEYRNYFKDMRIHHPERIMILDNSAYEYFVKGEKLNLQKFKEAIEDLKPTYYILPDVLMDRQSTLHLLAEFCDKYIPDCDSEPMAVAQGMTAKDLKDCLRLYSEQNISAVCIPFHNRFFKEYEHIPSGIVEAFMDEYGMEDPSEITEDMKYAMGRVYFVRMCCGLLKTFDYVHLLGSHCPFEKAFYHDLDSMDTGYPVKLGYEGIELGRERKKPDVIIDEFFHDHLTTSKIKLIHDNVVKFKEY